MNVLHNPLFDYNVALSHFLQARRQNCYLPVGVSSASGSDTGTESLSPSPPAITNHHSNKSFTIDAILGLRNSNNAPASASNPARRNSNVNLEAVLDYSNANSVAIKRSLGSSSEKSEDGGSNNGKSAGKSKRVRTIFTPEQLERLEAEFERQQYMVGPERLYLAHTLQLTEAQVKVWFQNRRIKWRKQHLEMTQQRLALLKQHRQQRMIQHQQKQQQESQQHSSSVEAAKHENISLKDHHHHHHHNNNNFATHSAVVM